MLDTVLKEIATRFNDFILPQSGGQMGQLFKLIVGDIAQHAQAKDQDGNDSIENNIVLTLVNIEEETSLKNNYPVIHDDNVLINQKPTLYLNLYLLFAANFTNYEESLKHVGYVLRFFQSQNKISFVDSFGNSYGMLFTLHNVGFENMNNLWVVLGSQYKPSALYKVRLMFIQEAPPTSGDLITNIHSNEHLN